MQRAPATLLAVVAAASGCGLDPYPAPGDDTAPFELPRPDEARLEGSSNQKLAREESWIALGAPPQRVDGCRAFLAGRELLLWAADPAACVPQRRGEQEIWAPLSTSGSPAIDTWYAATARGRLVVYGHSDGEHRAATYDPDTDSWNDTQAFAMGHDPREVIATSADDTVLFWGGYDVDPADPGQKLMPRFVWYDADEDGFQLMSLASMPPPRYAHGSVWDSHHMFVFGGRDYEGELLGDWAMYDLSSHAWEHVAATGAPSPRARPAVAWTGYVYVVFGGTADEETFLSDGGIYVPEPRWAWHPMSPSDDFAPRHPQGFWTGEHVVFLQTRDAPLALARYLPAADAWEPIEPPAALHDFVVADVHWDWGRHRALLWGRHGDGSCALWAYSPPYATDPTKGHPGDNLAGNQTDP